MRPKIGAQKVGSVKGKIRSYINIGALLLTLLFNYLSNAIPFNGLTQADLSELYFNLFTPAGYVFSIWGVIYLLLTCFAIYQLIPAYRARPMVEAVGYLFAVTALFNISWLFTWHYLRPGWAMLIMLLFLVTLILIYISIRKAKRNFRESFFDWLFVRLPFTLYFAWISVATIANLNAWLSALDILGTGVGSVLFTILMIAAAVLIATWVFSWQHDVAFVLVYVWALNGIGLRHGTDYLLLALIAWLAVIFLIFYMLNSLRKRTT